MDFLVASSNPRAADGKRFRVSKKFLADLNGQDAGVGDEVEITECRPISKRKCFKIIDVRKRAPRLADVKMEEVETKVEAIKNKYF